MPIRLAKRIGFCFGVKRAVEMAEDVLKNEKRAYSLGSIIHNKHVVKRLSEKGLKVIKDVGDVRSGVVVVSSHGISPDIADEISKRSLKLIDTTCPFVRSAQRIARALSEEGYEVIIVGDADHPEVRSLVDFAGKKAHVVKDRKAFAALKLSLNPDKIGILSQTTQSMDNYLEVVRAVIEKAPGRIRAFNTICRDAQERQDAARDVARESDLMLIAGGRNSANTKRLLEVCRKILKKSYLIESEKDIKGAWFKSVRAVGITSGASTPDWMVGQVADAVKTRMHNSKITRERKVAKVK